MIYRILRALLWLSLSGFFRRIEVQGAARIPSEGPTLFVCNHTNAFVDPLILLTALRRRVTLTAKSTLTRNPLLAALGKGLGVIFLHRASDSADGEPTPSNRTAMGAAVSRLRQGGAVLIFPEGVSHSDPSMRTFRTGAARIVSLYVDSAPEQELWIVPVGLHFSKKDRWRSDAVALVGEPVAARRWASPGERGRATEALGTPELHGVGQKSSAQTSPSVDVRALTDAMRGWIEALTLNFSSEAERELLTQAEHLMRYQPEGPRALHERPGFDALARTHLVHRLQRGAHELRRSSPASFEALAHETRVLHRTLERLGVDAEEVSLPMDLGRALLFVVRELEVLLVGAPLALLGWALNVVPLGVTRRIVRKTSMDEDHTASNAVFLAIPIFCGWWLLLGLAAAATRSVFWALAGVLTVVFTWSVHLQYRDRAGGVVRRVRTFWLWLRHPEARERLAERVEAWIERVRAAEAELAHHTAAGGGG